MLEEKLGVGSQINHTEFGQGVVVEINLGTYTTYFKQRGIKEINQSDSRISVSNIVPDTVQRLSVQEVENVLGNVLRKWSDVTEVFELGEKWKDGTIIIKPGKEGKQAKEIPIDTFFNKIVMTRDRLRVMEQKINSSKLENEEKIALQQYITRIYGSLTTFNVLFANKADHFKGMGS